MEYIDKYFEQIHYIFGALRNPKCSKELKKAIKMDVLKTMLVGASLSVALRFSIHHRYYRFKNYLNSSVLGCVFGVVYSPYFLVRKIDK
jgi:hypothetical protein